MKKISIVSLSILLFGFILGNVVLAESASTGLLIDGMPTGTKITFLMDFDFTKNSGSRVLLNDGTDLTERWCYIQSYESTKISSNSTFVVTSSKSSELKNSRTFEEVKLGNESQDLYVIRCTLGIQAKNVIEDLIKFNSDFLNIESPI